MQEIKDFKKSETIDSTTEIWMAIMSMDPYLLNQLLDDEIDYEDIGKQKFIKKLNDRFQNHRTLGDSELLLDLDHCKSCNCDQPICKFIGNVSGKHFGLYFDIQKGKIMDIYHCNWYGNIDFSNPF